MFVILLGTGSSCLWAGLIHKSVHTHGTTRHRGLPGRGREEPFTLVQHFLAPVTLKPVMKDYQAHSCYPHYITFQINIPVSFIPSTSSFIYLFIFLRMEVKVYLTLVTVRLYLSHVSLLKSFPPRVMSVLPNSPMQQVITAFFSPIRR